MNSMDHSVNKTALGAIEDDSWLGEKLGEFGEIHFQLGLDWYKLQADFAMAGREQCFVYSHRDKAGEYAILPVIVDHQSSTIRSLATYYTSCYLPLISEAGGGDSLVLILQYLFRVERFSTLQLQPLPEGASSTCALQTALKAAPEAVWSAYHHSVNWRLSPAPASWLEYQKSLPGQLRNTIKRNTKKFIARTGALFDIYLDDKAIAEKMADFQDVYHHSWKQPEPWPEFIPNMVAHYALTGRIRLGVAYLAGEAIAAQIWVVNGGTAHIYKLAQKEGYGRLSVGTLLTAKLFKHVMEVDGVQAIDFMSGDDAYKSAWMNQQRALLGLIVHNKGTVRGWLRSVKLRTRKWIKARLNR